MCEIPNKKCTHRDELNQCVLEAQLGQRKIVADLRISGNLSCTRYIWKLKNKGYVDWLLYYLGKISFICLATQPKKSWEIFNSPPFTLKSLKKKLGLHVDYLYYLQTTPGTKNKFCIYGIGKFIYIYLRLELPCGPSTLGCFSLRCFLAANRLYWIALHGLQINLE